MMKNPIDQIKEEFMERYGLNAEQVNIEVSISGVSKELAGKIAVDYGNKYDYTENYFMGPHCASVSTKKFNMWVHFKEGETDEELIIE